MSNSVSFISIKCIIAFNLKTISLTVRVLCKESTSLSLYNIQYANAGSAEEMEPTPFERGVSLTEPNESILSFAWSCNDENRLLYSTSSLSIKDHTVVDRITLNWSPSSKLVWNCGKKILQYIDKTDSIYDRYTRLYTIIFSFQT